MRRFDWETVWFFVAVALIDLVAWILWVRRSHVW